MKSVKIDSLHMELFSGKKTKNLILDHLIEILLLALIIVPSFTGRRSSVRLVPS